MADTQYLDDLIDAIKFVYERSDGYFKTTEGRERSMVFRIAHRLANQIEGEGLFVDIEPTRCNGIKKTCQHEDDNKEHHIYPDLIIHKRNAEGCLVAEFKCSTDRWEHDEHKLECLTTPRLQRENRSISTPFYRYGAFVYLTNKFENIEIHIFKDGCENTKLTKIYQEKFKEK